MEQGFRKAEVVGSTPTPGSQYTNNMYSRRQSIEERENKRKAVGFTLLSIAFIVFMFYFGLPIVARISNFTYDLKKSGEPVENSDQTPPPPPHFDNLPLYTKDENLEISGYSEAGVAIEIFNNDQKKEILADSSGRFSTALKLNEGENTLYGYSQDSSGNKSLESETFKIYLDKKKPDLTVSKPKNGEEFIGSKQKQISIEGKTEKYAQIQINDRFVVVNSDGSFNYIYGLNQGENPLTIKSEDQAGNITEISIKVTFTP